MSEVEKTDLSIISNKYAVAIIEIAEKNCILDAVNADLYLIRDVIRSNSELKKFVEHPLIRTEDKKDVLDQILKEEISIYTLNLVKLLADRKRLFILPYLCNYYNKILCNKRNMDTAKVITAIPIDENTINRIKEKLERLFEKQINIKTMIDEDLIAGMVIKIDDKVIDGSIKTRLENMKKQLC